MVVDWNGKNHDLQEKKMSYTKRPDFPIVIYGLVVRRVVAENVFRNFVFLAHQGNEKETFSLVHL